MILALLASFLNFAPGAYAAPCCAGSGVSVLTLQGDERWSVGFAMSRSTLDSDVGLQGELLPRDPAMIERTQAYQLSAIGLLADRWQVGLAVPVLEKWSLDSKTSFRGLGDGQAALTYEFLPEFEYSSWKPKGFLSFEIAAPLGRSVHDAREADFIDATSRGYWAAGLSLAFVKRWSDWSVGLVLRGRQGFARSVADLGIVAPGFEFGGRVEAAYSLPLGLFLGVSVEPVLQTAGSVFGTSTSPRQTLNETLSLSGPLGENIGWSVSGFTQGFLWLGNNTSLSSGIAVALSYRDWR